MVDVNYLKKLYSEYSTNDLLKYILVKSEDLVPEALAVVKSEFEQRESDLRDLFRTEFKKSGSIDYKFLDTKHITYVPSEDPRADPIFGDASGTLYLTSTGIYFIPIEVRVRNPSLPHGLLTYQLGLLGAVLEEVFFEKQIAIDGNEEYIPLTLLTRVMDYSFGAGIKELKSTQYSNRGIIRIKTRDDRQAEIKVKKSEIPQIKLWIYSHDISSSRKKGIFERLT